MTIKIFNLSLNTNETDLQRMFLRFGLVDTVELDRSRFDGRSKGSALVHMPVEREAQMAIISLDKTLVDGKKISVEQLQD